MKGILRDILLKTRPPANGLFARHTSEPLTRRPLLPLLGVIKDYSHVFWFPPLDYNALTRIKYSKRVSESGLHIVCRLTLDGHTQLFETIQTEMYTIFI